MNGKKRGSYSGGSSSEDNEIYHPTAKPQNYRYNNKNVTSNKGQEMERGFRGGGEGGTESTPLCTYECEV